MIRAGEEHFNLISAFIKSLRGSDPGWGPCTGWSGCWPQGMNPIYILRRMIRLATEGMSGLADPGRPDHGDGGRCLLSQTWQGPRATGSLYQAAVYLATAPPKSNAVYAAPAPDSGGGQKARGPSRSPMHIRNAPHKN